MSNDLIKRQNAIESIWSIFNNTYNDASRFEAEETELARKVLVDVQRVIESQPTAYDVDKVVEQLEEKTEIAYNRYMDCSPNTPPSVYARYGTQYNERKFGNRKIRRH